MQSGRGSMKVLFALTAALAVALAGCTQTPTDDEPADDEPADLQPTATGLPDVVPVGQPFTFPLQVAGDTAQSDHIGAHYWTAPPQDPTAEFDQQAGGCVHTTGSLPDTFDVTCTLDEAGTYTLHGHVRLGSGDNTQDEWTGAHDVQAVAAYGLSYATEVPAETTAGQSFSFELLVEGEAGSSGHIGAHYWTEATEDPTGDFSAQAGGCLHVEGTHELPGQFEVTCTIDEPGTYHLRGHVRTHDDSGGANHWGPGVSVTVSE